jgi:hypothetical protein
MVAKSFWIAMLDFSPSVNRATHVLRLGRDSAIRRHAKVMRSQPLNRDIEAFVEMAMEIATNSRLLRSWPRQNKGVLIALLVAASAGAGWMRSATSSTTAAEIVPAHFTTSLDDLKPGLIGSYEVTGTEPDGTPYVSSSILDITLTPSGALELSWENGRYVGVGQVIGNVLAVASVARGRTTILVMNINPDGSLSGKALRRTERGSKGTEVWKRI